MPIPTVRIKRNLQELYCPFTGVQVSGPDVGAAQPATLLFAYMGDAGEVESEHPAVLALLEKGPTEEEHEAEGFGMVSWLAGRLDVAGAFVIEVDGGWNGVNAWAFCPVA